jgi:hypothetical protein
MREISAASIPVAPERLAMARATPPPIITKKIKNRRKRSREKWWALIFKFNDLILSNINSLFLCLSPTNG